MIDTGSWVYDYSSTFSHWLIVGIAVILVSFLIQRLLKKLGMNNEASTGLALIMPWFIGFLIFNVYPFVASFYLSLTEYNLLSPLSFSNLPELVGFKNYIYAFTEDPNFWPSIRLTLLYGLISIPLGLAGALGTAMLLNREVKAVGVWRTLYYLPAVLPGAATALLWRWMFNPSNGLINTLLSPVLKLFNIPNPAWFTNPDLVLPSFVIMGMWGIFGTTTVILLAGLKNIPNDLYESATIDGANQWRKFLNITLPMMTPTLFYVLITSLIGALQYFTQALFITTPREAGVFINVYIWQQAFNQQKMGYASALAWILLAITLLLTLLVFRSSSMWVFYESDVSSGKKKKSKAKIKSSAQGGA